MAAIRAPETLVTEPQAPLADLLAAAGGTDGALADPALLTRLGLKVGDRITLGGPALRHPRDDRLRARQDRGRHRLRAAADRVAGGPAPHRPRAAGQPQPLELPASAAGRPTIAGLDAAAARIAAAAPQAGWEMRARTNADPRFSKSIERFTQFLTLVGFTALIVGGVGVANAVNAFVERKRPRSRP